MIKFYFQLLKNWNGIKLFVLQTNNRPFNNFSTSKMSPFTIKQRNEEEEYYVSFHQFINMNFPSCHLNFFKRTIFISTSAIITTISFSCFIITVFIFYYFIKVFLRFHFNYTLRIIINKIPCFFKDSAKELKKDSFKRIYKERIWI